MSARLEPAESARVCGRAARVLAVALEHERNSDDRGTLASSLSSLEGRFDSPEAAPIYSQAARSLAKVLALETDREVREKLGSALSSMAARMAPAEATRILADALKQGSNPSSLAGLARVLSATLNRIDAAEADRVCEQLIGSLDRDALETIAPKLLPHLNPERAHALAWDLAAKETIAPKLLPHLDPERAHALAWDLASRLCSEPVFDDEALSRMLTDDSREQRTRRVARMAKAGPGPEGMLEAAVRVAAEPFPCRLTTQELVELLKMPTCFRGTRRIVLDHLGNRYSRHFVNHWAFVRFANEQKLGLDFTTPPRRPDDKARSVRPERERKD